MVKQSQAITMLIPIMATVTTITVMDTPSIEHVGQGD